MKKELGVKVKEKERVFLLSTVAAKMLIGLPGPNTWTCGSWVLIPSRAEGEVASELVVCTYPPGTTEKEVMNRINKGRDHHHFFFFSKKSHGLMTHQSLHA